MNFAKILIAWYKKNKRDLPWRKTQDPYKIWLSEIILQQTRIDQGMVYYLKFVSRFPDVHKLANASEQDILILWQGLGYYSRARNIHKTAMTISNDRKGLFPDNYDELLKLAGIGEYTAAAISSIAFNESRPVVDGNVLRFLSRLNGIETPVDSNSGKTEITNLATNLIDRKQPGEFNQAIMEFGALYCKPRNPDCNECIFRTDCKAYLKNKVGLIPVKSKRLLQRDRYFHFLFIIWANKKIYLRKRSGPDIWRNLYDFPLIEKTQAISQEKIVEEISNYLAVDFMNNPKFTISKDYKHILTHQVITAKFYTIWITDLRKFQKINSLHGNYWDVVDIKNIHQYPVPRLIEKFLKNFTFF
jgi:A/G-specific adenine glycosylase